VALLHYYAASLATRAFQGLLLMNDPLVNALANLFFDGLIFVFVVGSMFWVFFDSRKLMTGLTRQQRKAISPMGPKTGSAWTAGCVCFWIVFFPWYLMVRGGYKRAQAKRTETQQKGFPVIMKESDKE
jgi:hypothetical protein